MYEHSYIYILDQPRITDRKVTDYDGTAAYDKPRFPRGCPALKVGGIFRYLALWLGSYANNSCSYGGVLRILVKFELAMVFGRHGWMAPVHVIHTYVGSFHSGRTRICEPLSHLNALLLRASPDVRTMRERSRTTLCSSEDC